MIMEHVVYCSIINYFVENNLLHAMQHGFITTLSYETQLFEFETDIHEFPLL